MMYLIHDQKGDAVYGCGHAQVLGPDEMTASVVAGLIVAEIEERCATFERLISADLVDAETLGGAR